MNIIQVAQVCDRSDVFCRESKCILFLFVIAVDAEAVILHRYTFADLKRSFIA